MSARDRRGKRRRHSWNRHGQWLGSKDQRTCTVCGVTAYKTGMYSGWRWWFPGESEDAHGGARMPECPGPPEASSS